MQDAQVGYRHERNAKELALGLVANLETATAKNTDRAAIFVAEVPYGLKRFRWAEGGLLIERNWCVYRQLKRGRSGDEVRPGWHVNE